MKNVIHVKCWVYIYYIKYYLLQDICAAKQIFTPPHVYKLFQINQFINFIKYYKTSIRIKWEENKNADTWNISDVIRNSIF